MKSYSSDEQLEVEFNDCFDNTTVDAGDINTQESSSNEQDGKEGEVKHFLGFPAWNDDFDKSHDSFEKNHIHIAFAFFLWGWGF